MPEISHLGLGPSAETSELRVAEPELLHVLQFRGVRLRSRLRRLGGRLVAGGALEAVRRFDQLGELVQKPRVDAGE